MDEDSKRRREPIAVSVSTPSGSFPSEDDARIADERTLVKEVLAAAATHLRLTDTSGWVVKVDDRDIDPSRSFAENKLRCVVVIEWHKPEGGGGA